MQSPGSSMISIGGVTIKDGFQPPSVVKGRKSSLPMIKGVNKNSLGLLIDQPENLANQLTPLARRGFGALRQRNNSV